jgi:SagB-type dehydrogenase family enzyme
MRPARRAMRRPRSFRRAPCLVSYWQDEHLVFENYSTGSRVTAHPLTSEILDFFDCWRTVDAAAARFSQFSPDSVRAAVNALERQSFLECSDRVPDARTTALASWNSWNPAAGFFHLSTKDVPYAADQLHAGGFLRRKTRQVPEPPPVKRYPGTRQHQLPAPVDTGEFPDVLMNRRTWREFSRRPVTVADLSTLLGLTWRVQSWSEAPGLRPAPLKTSPSGGARSPIEVYVLALRVEGLPRGIYHYAADRHRLESLQAGSTRRQILRYLPGQPWFTGAAALILMTAVFSRTQWKYPFARAYRVVLAEAGHLCQTFCLTATWLGLAPFCTMALADSQIERDLKLDGVTESVLYAAGVGTRPASRSGSGNTSRRSAR